MRGAVIHGVDDLINKMAGEERDFQESTFLAPVIKGSRVSTRISGVVISFSCDSDFEGWAVLRPLSWKKAHVLREASFGEIDDYLALFPKVRMILATPREGQWLAHPSNWGDARTRFGWKRSDFRPVYLVRGAEQFEHVICRYDGRNLWFENVESARDPAIGEVLRKAFNDKTDLGELRIPTLTPDEKIAYAFARGIKYGSEDWEKDKATCAIKRALEHADANLVSYVDQGETLLVRYIVDGEEFLSSISKEDFTVVSAGICLSGQDSRFDLTSLVTVLREGKRHSRINRIDGDYDD